MTEMKDGIWCLLEAEGICEYFQFSSSIALSIGTEQKETALGMGPRVPTFTVQWLKKKEKKVLIAGSASKALCFNSTANTYEHVLGY